MTDTPNKPGEQGTRTDICRKILGRAEPGNTCLQTPGTCESCPNWENTAAWAKPKRCISTVKIPGVRCASCGKNTAKRRGKAPAPILLTAGSIHAALCMTCAKQISSKLDVIIAGIEERYGKL